MADADCTTNAVSMAMSGSERRGGGALLRGPALPLAVPQCPVLIHTKR
jgi:hypothetical protein